MGEFSKIERSFWETDEAREMTPEEKYFWLYLRTNANVNTLGCYTFRMRKAMDETGYNRETLEKLLKRMEECGYIFYCAETGEVLLLGWGAQNWTKKTVIKRAIAGDLKNVRSNGFFALLSQMLSDAGIFFLPLPYADTEDADERDEDTEEQPGADAGMEEQAETSGNNEEQWGTNGTEKEKEREKEKEKKESISPLPLSGAQKKRQLTHTSKSAAFSAFWAAYPNRKNKQQAAKAWDKLKITPEKYRAIMDGLERAKASEEWADTGGKFIPYPSTWLNAGGWENEYKPLRPSLPQTPPTPPLYSGSAAVGQLYSGPAAVSQPFAERTARLVPPDDALERRRRLAGAYKTEAQRADSSALAVREAPLLAGQQPQSGYTAEGSD